MLDHQSTEEWRTVAEFPSYEVSDFGRIRRKAIERPHNTAGGIQRYPERLRKSCFNPHNGYMQILFCENRKKTMRLIHRVVAEAFIGGAADMDVNHKSGVRTDNALGNLEIVTRADNLRHGREVLKTTVPLRTEHVIRDVTNGRVLGTRPRGGRGKNFECPY